MKQKGQVLIIGIIIGMLVAGGLFGAYYFGTLKNSKLEITNSVSNSENPQATTMPAPIQTPDETTSWESFTNKKYNYAIKYPAYWIAFEGITPDEVTLELVPHAPVFGGLITILAYTGNLNPESVSITKVESERNITVGGKETKTQIGTDSFSGKGTRIHVGPITKDGQNYLFIFTTGDQIAKPEDIAVFEKILSTFKFTN